MVVRTKILVVVGLLSGALAGCGGDDSGGDTSNSGSGGVEGGGGSGLPNACELFTEADTAEYGGLGVGSHTSAAIDICIYTETINNEVLQISVVIGPDEGYAPALGGLDQGYDASEKSAASYGDESFMFVRADDTGGSSPDSRGDLIILRPPYYVQVSTRLNDSATALQDIAQTVLGRI